MKRFKIFFLLISSIAFRANAVIRYVTPAGAGSMNGISWVNAFPGTSLQEAITASAPGDEVWVMTGTYFTTTTANRNIYFSMQNGVAIYGSFNGTETSLTQRNFSCGFTSVLSAEIGVPGNADNSYHVINNSSLNTTAILDGFVITGANANFDLLGNDNRSLGGGMLNNAANSGVCTPTIRNCLFTNNTALFGGGIFDHGQNSGDASPVITNCIFAFNTATGGGGAIDNFGYNGNASPVITNCIFYSNTATDRAGAMYCWGGGNGNASPVILNSVFVNNSSFDGGAIVADRSNFVSGNSGTANPVIQNSIFWGNSAGGTGPQFFLIGSAGFAATYSIVDISNQNVPHTITGAGTGNLSVAPTFITMADADGADNCWLTSDDGLQLQGASAGIDAGNNTGVPVFDIRNYNRIANSTVDIGAYEFNSTVLPVRLLAFNGRAEGYKNILYWSTASESNSSRFEIERSNDAILFETIGAMAAAGNSATVRQYQFADNRLTKAQHYYRLKQIDNDGRFDLSTIIVVSNSESQSTVSVFPNPVENTATLLFQGQILAGEEFLLFNSTGQQIAKLLISGNTAQVDLSGKPAGVYILSNQKLGITVRIQKMAE
ncbi:MAG: choice-of-anchor Q domain-containing protein [Chitinophagaceae bacterium]